MADGGSQESNRQSGEEKENKKAVLGAPLLGPSGGGNYTYR